ncbi:MAG: VWA domain-containing protein [Defluviitaleaceae bacterium]|nr:VWA domain-containing protein [Defluviitaleaceae bacterium]
MKKIAAFVIIIGLILFATGEVFATAETENLIPIDAVLVLDVSLSMRTADPNRISRDAMNLFIDMLTEGRDRVGIVSYAGRVERSLDLTEIHSQEDRDMLYEFIHRLEYASWTDHGVGLVEAMRILQDGEDETAPRQGIIIFLTDGNMNVNPATVRTNLSAQQEVYDVIDTARELQIPIHTIGLNVDGNLALAYINHIAEATYGLSFETAHAEDIPPIIEAFFHAMITAPQLRIEGNEIPSANDETLSPSEIEAEAALQAKIDALNLHEISAEKIANHSEVSTISRNTIIAIAATGAVVLLLILVLANRSKRKRVFTGKLSIEVIDGNSRSISPITRNLIEHGRHTNLTRLIGKEVNPAFNTVTFTPSPTAPSHLPQLFIKCKNPHVKFTKDFMAQNITKGISVGIGAEMTIQLDTEDMQVRLRYIM